MLNILYRHVLQNLRENGCRLEVNDSKACILHGFHPIIDFSNQFTLFSYVHILVFRKFYTYDSFPVSFIHFPQDLFGSHDLKPISRKCFLFYYQITFKVLSIPGNQMGFYGFLTDRELHFRVAQYCYRINKTYPTELHRW